MDDLDVRYGAGASPSFGEAALNSGLDLWLWGLVLRAGQGSVGIDRDRHVLDRICWLPLTAENKQVIEGRRDFGLREWRNWQTRWI